MEWPEIGQLNVYPVAFEGVLDQDPELPLQLPSFFSGDFVWIPRFSSVGDDEFASPWISSLQQTQLAEDSPFPSPLRLPITAPEVPQEPSYIHAPPNAAQDSSSPSYCTRLAEISLSPLSRPFSLPPTPSTSHGFPQQSNYPSPALSTPGLTSTTFLTSYNSPSMPSPLVVHEEELRADNSDLSPTTSTTPLALMSHRRKRGRNDSAVQRQRKGSSVANFICEVCGVDFTTKGALGIHVKTKHGAEDYRLHCEHPTCPRSYLDKSSLARHQKSEGHGRPKTHKRRRLRSEPTPE
ncbi:hypothetical protein CPB85DRAFT_1349022 [Mucidula mucida]|nr:hypothetical protein CPB85DRAFT_1349022 [Mucidula mucida]